MRQVETESLGSVIRNAERSVASFGREEAQDVVQEALIRAIDNGVTCDAEPWLKTVARRIAIDRTRRSRELPSTGEPELDLFVPSAERSPEEVILGNEGVEAIRGALRSLPPRYRDALLTYVETEDARGVAERMGISLRNAHVLLCRARARLKRELDHVGYSFGLLVDRFHRWTGEVAATAAVACIALAVGVPGTEVERLQVLDPTEVLSASVEATDPQPSAPAHEASPVQEVAPAEPTEVVADPEPESPEPIASYAVAACGPKGQPLPLGLEVEIIDDVRHNSLVGRLVKRLPEPLRVMEADTCR